MDNVICVFLGKTWQLQHFLDFFLHDDVAICSILDASDCLVDEDAFQFFWMIPKKRNNLWIFPDVSLEFAKLLFLAINFDDPLNDFADWNVKGFSFHRVDGSLKELNGSY